MKIKKFLPKKSDYPNNLNVIYDKNSEYYCSVIEASGSAYHDSIFLVKRLFLNRLETVLSMIDRKRYKNVLDAGTGLGVMLPVLSSMSEKVTALDYSNIIEYTKCMVKKKNLKNIKFVKDDVLTFNPKEKFDLIMSLSVIEHIKDTDKAFANFKNMLKKGGILIIGYPVETKLVKFFRKTDSKFFRKSIDKKIEDHAYEHAEEFHGHVSDYKKIRHSMKKYFRISKEKDLKILFNFTTYYSLKKAQNE